MTTEREVIKMLVEALEQTQQLLSFAIQALGPHGLTIAGYQGGSVIDANDALAAARALPECQGEPIGSIVNGKLVWNTDGGPNAWRKRKDYSGPLYTTPQPIPADVVRGDERYRWLRDICDDPEIYLLTAPEELDAAIDAAINGGE